VGTTISGEMSEKGKAMMALPLVFNELRLIILS
jgi:hypothetical protein